MTAILAVVIWFWWAGGKPKELVNASPPPQKESFASTTVNSSPVPTNRVVATVPPPVSNPPPAIKTSPPPAVAIAPRAPEVANTNTAAPSTNGFPRLVRDVFEAQVALARFGISSGSLDGVMGSQTRAALIAYQQTKKLPASGDLNAETRAALQLSNVALVTYVVTPEDLARLQPLSKTWLGKSQQSALDFESILELVAERGRASPNLIRRLNPRVDWTNVTAGTEIKIPDATNGLPTAKAAFAAIKLSEKNLEVFDAETNLLAHFPCSIAARFDKRPVGELHVKAIAPDPDYTFNPEVFPESEEAQQIKTKLILPPGPNNPVGTAWVSLDRSGYGIHGTPNPEQVGRTESHGCFRLANWNAECFLKMVWIGMPVFVEP